MDSGEYLGWFGSVWKHLGGWGIALSLLWTASPVWAFPTPVASPPPAVSARAAILVDARTGSILYAKQAFQQMDPASITKVMTAILTIQHGSLDREVVISKRAAGTPGSRLHIRAGDRYQVMDLLRGLLMRSGNDASVALAEANAGSVERFVAQMNQEAQVLGAFNTSFANPNGLTAPGAYSSAYDLAMIGRYAMTLPLFRALVRTSEDKVTEQSRGQTRTVHNTNALLEAFPGADGIKTGTTSAAGKCLLASATRHGRRLIAVVLNSSNRWGDAAALLSWGFENSETLPVVARGQALTRVAVDGGQHAHVVGVAGTAVWATLPLGAEPEMRLAVPHRIHAPIVRGQRLGTVSVVVNGDAVAHGPVVAEAAVPNRILPFWGFAWLRWFNYGDGAS